MGVCLFGLGVALIGLLPVFSEKDSFPWPVFAGPAIYMPAAFGLVYLSRGPNMKSMMTKLRFIRLGFVAVFAVAVYRLMPLN